MAGFSKYSFLIEIIGRIWNPKTTTMLLLHYLLASTIFLMGFYHLFTSAAALGSPYIFRKDFVQEYVLARAVLSETEPYQPISELVQKFIGPVPVPVFNHPTPHPPPVAVLVLPLGLLGFCQAAIIWYTFEIFCIVLTIYIFWKFFDDSYSPLALMLSLLAIFAWNPIWEELVLGQLTSLLFLLLVIFWIAMRKKRFVLGGLLLGLVISFKLICWPLLIYFAFRKNWQIVLSSIITMITANGLAAILMGIRAVTTYYLETGILVGSLYRADVGNFSLYGLGWKIFDGTKCSVLTGAQADAIVSLPVSAGIVAVVLPIVLLIMGLYFALRMRDFDATIALLVCISLIVSPLLWTHYLILLVIPFVVLFKRLYERGFPKSETILSTICVVLILIPDKYLYRLVTAIGTYEYRGDDPVVDPWILLAFGTLPNIVILLLSFLLLRLDAAGFPYMHYRPSIRSRNA